MKVRQLNCLARWTPSHELPTPSSGFATVMILVRKSEYFYPFPNSEKSYSLPKILFYRIKSYSCSNSLIEEGKGSIKKKQKNMDISIFGSNPPTPPPNMDKTNKNILFLGFLAHLEQKKILKIFHLENFSTLIFMDRFS